MSNKLNFVVAFFLAGGLFASTAHAGIVNPGEYIGGDALYVAAADWDPQGGGGLFFADSGDGTDGWGTRAPQ